MIVYKFGGASVKDAKSIKRLAGIAGGFEYPAVMVVSAMGKTTNFLEEVVSLKTAGGNWAAALMKIMEAHLKTLSELFPSKTEVVFDEVINVFSELNVFLTEYEAGDFDRLYDRVVSTGEILSTKIVSAYLLKEGLENRWMDIRKYLVTSGRHREAVVDIGISEEKIRAGFDFKDTALYVTQGFIGADGQGNATTLGREGSDYTAALIANFLNAGKVVLWKDVKGIYNADPKKFDHAVLLNELSYNEAVELTFYGAKIIHPKTIKPVQNKNIPVYVKSFESPDEPGSVIRSLDSFKPPVPVFIIKENQWLLSVRPCDYSFIVEKHIGELFNLLTKNGIKVNLLQNSAVSFSVCCDAVDDERLEKVTNYLKSDFRVLYNTGLELITIRHYDENSIRKMISGKKVLLEQRSRNTVQFVVKG